MRKAWMPPARWIVGVIALLAVSSTLQAWRLDILAAKASDPYTTADFAKIFVLNLAYWVIPALCLPLIVSVARRFRFDNGRKLVALAVHMLAAVAFAVVRQAGMISVKILLWPNLAFKMPETPWSVYVQRQFLSDFDWCLMVYASIVGVSHAVAYYHESQQRKVNQATLETRLVEAQLKTLQAELHPHFLFNTLHAISTLVHRDPEAADRMISRLSDLLRITFDRSGEPRISLKEEIEFLQKYLEIEQTRFQDRLTVRVEIDPDALDGEVPRMILQPLVENAIKHGVGNRSEGGQVQITAGREGDFLWMQVRDNGGGLQGGTLRALNKGVGLSNTRARLDCLYRGRHQLVFTDQRGGLAVRVEIPYTRAAAPGIPAAAFRVA
ncbi:MAG TPA: sensor histidine kinase [Vicinamibacterales bacterium]|nr:sensor histidine kinase [Vicinamibacterales bacterium]